MMRVASLVLPLLWQRAAAEPSPVVLAFLGRQDTAYSGLLAAVQQEASSKGLKVLTPQGSFGSFEDMESSIQELVKANPGSQLVYMGHGMGEGGGAKAAQDYAVASKVKAAGVVLVAGFLDRSWRPSVVECAKTWEKQPSVRCPGKPLCPGGYLEDGVHNCTGPAVPAPQYPLPTLSVGGALDGVVRASRMAEAWYTQRAQQQHAVKLVEGMSHSDLLDSVPAAVAAADLETEIGSGKARAAVARSVVDFLVGEGLTDDFEADFFQPFTQMFVEEEGSWWWTSNSDEQGSSQWAAKAQQSLAAPLPEGVEWGQSKNQFHMLSDEDMIPPYYRHKHRPEITLEDGAIASSTVTQLRYVEVSVLQTAAGLNGWEIIKEEKAGVLADQKLALQDDGSSPTSAIEIATKLASRELVFNVSRHTSSPDLDAGDRCKDINQAAYNLALSVASPAARSRHAKQGRPLVMVADKKPTPPAGPWWIWNYLKFEDKPEGMEVASWYAFYPLSGPAYGAGNHYCKLLSPARALEWIYMDSLKKKKVQEVQFTV